MEPNNEFYMLGIATSLIVDVVILLLSNVKPGWKMLVNSMF